MNRIDVRCAIAHVSSLSRSRSSVCFLVNRLSMPVNLSAPIALDDVPSSSPSSSSVVPVGPLSSSMIPAVAGDSLISCIERFLLAEHTNSINILLYSSCLALFASSSLSRRLGSIVPPTDRFNVAFKLTVSIGLLCQLIFELKNCEKAQYSFSKPTTRSNLLPRSSSQGLMYASTGSSLSPPALRTPISNPLAKPIQLNITPVDRQLESVASSLMMFAMNQQILKSYFHREAAQVWESTAVLSLPTITKIYSACNLAGLFASIKSLLLTAFSSGRLDASACDPPRSLPLILPSFSFATLIHALFLHPQTEMVLTVPNQSIVSNVSYATPELITKSGSSAPILRIMAILSLYYCQLHKTRATQSLKALRSTELVH